MARVAFVIIALCLLQLAASASVGDKQEEIKPRRWWGLLLGQRPSWLPSLNLPAPPAGIRTKRNIFNFATPSPQSFGSALQSAFGSSGATNGFGAATNGFAAPTNGFGAITNGFGAATNGFPSFGATTPSPYSAPSFGSNFGAAPAPSSGFNFGSMNGVAKNIPSFGSNFNFATTPAPSFGSNFNYGPTPSPSFSSGVGSNGFGSSGFGSNAFNGFGNSNLAGILENRLSI